METSGKEKIFGARNFHEPVFIAYRHEKKVIQSISLFFHFFQPFSFCILVFKYITHENEQAFKANIEIIESK